MLWLFHAHVNKILWDISGREGSRCNHKDITTTPPLHSPVHIGDKPSSLQLNFGATCYNNQLRETMDNKALYNDEKTLIVPTKGRGEPSVGPDAIMVAIPSELQSMVDMSHAERAMLATSSTFKLFLIRMDDDLPLALAGPFLGAPQGVIIME